MGRANDVKKTLREAGQAGLTSVVIIGRVDDKHVYLAGTGEQAEAMGLVREILKAWANDEMK